ncbi:MAG: hypothetical protein R3E66_20020 [bacterium]
MDKIISFEPDDYDISALAQRYEEFVDLEWMTQWGDLGMILVHEGDLEVHGDLT